MFLLPAQLLTFVKFIHQQTSYLPPKQICAQYAPWIDNQHIHQQMILHHPPGHSGILYIRYGTTIGWGHHFAIHNGHLTHLCSNHVLYLLSRT